MKKILAVLLVAVMCFAFVAACAADETPPPPPPAPADTPAPAATPAPAPEPDAEPSARQLLAEYHGLPWEPHMEDWEPITFIVWDRNPGTAPAADNPVLNIVEEITNVRIQFEFLVGDLETALGTMLAAGGEALPHAGFFGGEAAAAIDSGHFIPIGDLIEAHAPNLRAHFAPWWELMRHTDGLIYTAEIFGTPTGEQHASVMSFNGTAFYMQMSVVDFHGRPPADLNEYFQFMYDYMQANPYTEAGVPIRGFEILTEGWRRFCIDNPPMFLQGHGNWGGAVNLDGIRPDSQPTPADRWMNDWNREYYEILNYWFHRGLIQADTLALSHEEYLAHIATGAVLGMSDQHWNFNAGQDPLRAADDWHRTMVSFDFTNPGVTPNYIAARSFTGSNGLNISTSNPDPIRFAQFMDWVIQENTQRFLAWGIEGENWHMENGVITRPAEQRVLQAESRWNYDNLGTMLRNLFPKMQGTFSDGNATDPDESPTEQFAGHSEFEREFFTRHGILHRNGFMRSVPYNAPVFYPFWGMSMADGSPEHIANQRITDVNTEWLARLVIAPEGQFDSLWEQYQAALAEIDQTPIFDFFRSEGERMLAAVGG